MHAVSGVSKENAGMVAQESVVFFVVLGVSSGNYSFEVTVVSEVIITFEATAMMLSYEEEDAKRF